MVERKNVELSSENIRSLSEQVGEEGAGAVVVRLAEGETQSIDDKLELIEERASNVLNFANVTQEELAAAIKKDYRIIAHFSAEQITPELQLLAAQACIDSATKTETSIHSRARGKTLYTFRNFDFFEICPEPIIETLILFLQLGSEQVEKAAKDLSLSLNRQTIIHLLYSPHRKLAEVFDLRSDDELHAHAIIGASTPKTRPSRDIPKAVQLIMVRLNPEYIRLISDPCPQALVTAVRAGVQVNLKSDQLTPEIIGDLVSQHTAENLKE